MMENTTVIIEPTIFQLEVFLLGISPKIWRRVQISSETNLAEFHLIIQKAMGWKNLHEFQFAYKRKNYYESHHPILESNSKTKKSSILLITKVSDLVQNPGDSMFYEYDFCLDWQHKIVLEEIIPKGYNPNIPVCIAGERNCPPEDCGGIWGYANLVSELRFNRTKRKSFNPEYFNRLSVNDGFMNP